MGGLGEIIKVAKGEAPCDLVLKDGLLVNVFSGEIYQADVGVFDGQVVGIGKYDGATEVNVKGKYISPGFIDGHVHIESSMVEVREFAKAVVPLGTTSVVIDPHEIANVFGLEGIQYMLKSSKFNPLNVFLMLPSCVPATEFETSGSSLKGFDLYPLLTEKWVLGIGEVMNYPGVLARDQDILDKITMADVKRVDGHAPNLTGRDLCAYVAAGVRSDHEGTSVEEVKEKLRLGLHIMIREGSLTKNLKTLLPLVTANNINRCFFVTDDRHPRDILEEGHIDYMVRTAIAAGIDPVSAIRLATVNGAEYFKLDRLGAVAPGYTADLLVLGSLDQVKVERVYKRGVLVAQDGQLLPSQFAPPKIALRSSINIKFLSLDDFKIPVHGKKIRAIELKQGDIKTGEAIADAAIRDGQAVSDPSRDIIKVLVIERHHASENIGRAFLKGLGLKRGALASSVSHDSHNIVVAGVNDEDMLEAVIEICRMKGGLAIVSGGKVLGRLPLPVAGLMSEGTMAQVKDDIQHLDQVAKELGVTIEEPFMALSFVTLAVMPDLKLTDLGLFDVRRFKFVDVFADA
ncbi:MAG TPA: adenine deaminase [bacterium]|nr:adenine deaminase [bacterium]